MAGSTVVTCTATDANGNTATKTFTVNVGADVSVGGDVAPTLSLTIGEASFGAFTPGIAKDYAASTNATVTSSAGDAALSVSEPGHLTNGAFSLASPLQVALAKSAWTAPVSNDNVKVDFTQHIDAGEALRTGRYSTTLTFTLSTTNP
jgi:X-Pro dipeptidyl-peptidase